MQQTTNNGFIDFKYKDSKGNSTTVSVKDMPVKEATETIARVYQKHGLENSLISALLEFGREVEGDLGLISIEKEESVKKEKEDAEFNREHHPKYCRHCGKPW